MALMLSLCRMLLVTAFAAGFALPARSFAPVPPMPAAQAAVSMHASMKADCMDHPGGSRAVAGMTPGTSDPMPDPGCRAHCLALGLAPQPAPSVQRVTRLSRVFAPPPQHAAASRSPEPEGPPPRL